MGSPSFEVKNRRLMASVAAVGFISIAVYLNIIFSSRMSPMGSGKVMSADSVDSIAADPQLSSSDALASALTWTRQREKVLLYQMNLALSQAAQLRANLSKLESLQLQNQDLDSGGSASSQWTQMHADGKLEWPTDAAVCTGRNSAFNLVNSSEGFFEDESWSGPRLDGVNQLRPISEKYSVWYCTNNDGLSGIFRLEKKFDCDETVHFSDDQEYSAYVRQNIGPDEFTLSLEGPEIYAMNPSTSMKYRGQCRYEMPFTLTVPGKYRLSLIWWRENYNGARENLRGWLPSHYDAPVGNNVYLYFGKQHADRGLERSQLIETLQKRRSGAGLPECDLRDPGYTYLSGRWVYISDDVEDIFMQSGPVPLHGNAKDTIETRGFLAHAYVNFSQYIWCPYQCRLKTFNPAEALSCLSSRHVVFQGDSHLRQLRSSLLNYICNVILEIGADGCGSPACPVQGLDMLCVERDGQAHSPSFLSATDADLNVANCGQHFADGERQRKFIDYKNTIDALVEKLKAIPAAQRRGLIWHETVSQPFRKDAWIKAYGDQRSNIRMRMYNQYATDRMRSINVPVIPVFAQTAGMVLISFDSAHYEYSILQHSSAQFVLGLLCPGSPSS